jgi:hypothetical protein
MSGFKKNIVFKLIIFLQIVIAAMSINLALGIFQYSSQFGKIPNDEIKKSGVLIVPSFDENNVKYISSVYKKIREEINRLPGIEQIGDISWFGVRGNNIGRDIQLYSYSKSIFSLNNIDLKNGNKSDYGYYKGINHVFASEESDLIYGKEYELSIPTGNRNFKKIKVKITGVLSKDTRLMTIQYGGTDMSIDALYRKPSSCIIASDIKDQVGKDLSKHSDPNVIVNLKKGVTIDDLRPNWDKTLSSYAKYLTISELIDKQKEQSFDKAKVQISIAIILLLMCLVGIVSGAIIKMLNETKEYGIYFMCGLVWRRSIIINAVSNIINVLIPFIIGTSIAQILTSGDHSKHVMNLNNILISFVFVILIFILTGAWSIIYLLRTPPISFLRRNT